MRIKHILIAAAIYTMILASTLIVGSMFVSIIITLLGY